MVFAVGVTATVYVPVPTPVLVVPLLNVSVHAPVVVTVPVSVVATFLHTVAFGDVKVAVGRGLSVTLVVPARLAVVAAQFASVKAVGTYVIGVVVGVTV